MLKRVGKIPWRRMWKPTPLSSPGRSHGQRSLADYNPWGHKESDTTEGLSMPCPSSRRKMTAGRKHGSPHIRRPQEVTTIWINIYGKNFKNSYFKNLFKS